MKQRSEGALESAGVHVVPSAPAAGLPGLGAVNICLLVEKGQITVIDAGLPGSSADVLST